ncbi:MAG: hypothetical protein AB1632_03650 [Nitrospirota bacterium]
MFELIKLGLKEQLTYIFLIYGLSFIIMFFALARSLRNTESRVYKEAFWMLAGFALTKGLSAWADATDLVVGETASLHGVTADNLSTILAVFSNLFILQFSVGMMTYRLPYRKIYQILPVVLFGGYIILFFSGMIERSNADSIGRFNFGYNGGVLTTVALVNLYHIQKQTKRTKLLRGISGLAIGFAFYSVFDGILNKPILGVPIYMFRMFCAVMITSASFYIKELFMESKTRKVDYI